MEKELFSCIFLSQTHVFRNYYGYQIQKQSKTFCSSKRTIYIFCYCLQENSRSPRNQEKETTIHHKQKLTTYFSFISILRFLVFFKKADVIMPYYLLRINWLNFYAVIFYIFYLNVACFHFRFF